MKKFQLLLIGVCLLQIANAQQQPAYTPAIEPCACPVKVDSSFKTRCGYLVVPENRTKLNSRLIKLPFVLVESKNKNKRNDPLLFTTGGPGGSSLGWAVGAARRSVINKRDCIAFEQRGTQYALPNLWSPELSDAIKESYKKNLNKDSMVLVGVRAYKAALVAKGIDLSGYNTDESVADIHDLLTALHIDSVNLLGGSYSGGLMLAVLQNDPTRIRSLILDSPLPTFVHIDEDEPANFNEALEIVFRHCDEDSADKARYGGMKEKFQQYFTAIGGKLFYIPYVEKGGADTLNIQYTRSDLLEVIENTLFDRSRIKDVPYIITEMIKGNHHAYIRDHLDGIFQYDNGPNGMRLSVYCADQAEYNNQVIIDQLSQVYPWMAGYHINDVYKTICDCWLVPPIRRSTKQPFYSNVPVLLSDGALDNACRPLYIDLIHHYMPNSQRLVFNNFSHMTGGPDLGRFIDQFLDRPYQKIVTDNPGIVAY
jgi:pimeloyl-ACP methyl ester carboxylesterase